MTKRQFQRIQCRVRRGVNGLYHSYLTGVLHGLRAHDHTGEVDRILAEAPSRRTGHLPTTNATTRRQNVVQRDLKMRADLSSARMRERLWQLQHLQLDPEATGYA